MGETKNRERLLSMIQGGSGRACPYIEKVRYRADTMHPESEAYCVYPYEPALMVMETIEQARNLLLCLYCEGDEEERRKGREIVGSAPVYDEGRYMDGINPFLNAWNRHYTNPEEFTPEELQEAERIRHNPKMGKPLPQVDSDTLFNRR